MFKNSAELINKIFIGIGAALEFAGCVCVAFNWNDYGTVDSSIVLGLVGGGMWLVVVSLYVYAARHDIDINLFSIPVYIVNKED